MTKVMTVPEVADHLKVHISTIYRLVKKNDLPAFKVGSDWRFNVDSIEKWKLDREESRNLPA